MILGWSYSYSHLLVVWEYWTHSLLIFIDYYCSSSRSVWWLSDYLNMIGCTCMFMFCFVDLTKWSSAYFFHEVVFQFRVAILFDHDHVLIEKDRLFLYSCPFCSYAFDTHNNSIEYILSNVTTYKPSTLRLDLHQTSLV